MKLLRFCKLNNNNYLQQHYAANNFFLQLSDSDIATMVKLSITGSGFSLVGTMLSLCLICFLPYVVLFVNKTFDFGELLIARIFLFKIEIEFQSNIGWYVHSDQHECVTHWGPASTDRCREFFRKQGECFITDVSHKQITFWCQ